MSTSPAHAASPVPSQATPPDAGPGLKIEEYSWGRIYRGRREAFLGAGLVREGHFPGDAGMPRWARAFDLGGRHVKIKRETSRLYSLWWSRTEAEREAAARERARLEAFDALRAHVAALPASPAAYREEVRTQLIQPLVELVFRLVRPRGGYRFTAESRAQIDGALQAVAIAVQAAEVAFDAAARERELAGIYDRHGATIPQDDAFERFLEAAIAPAPRPENDTSL
ncbi:MAG: hypothetical protein AB7P08_10330 [Burkholderiales bacterium]